MNIVAGTRSMCSVNVFAQLLGAMQSASIAWPKQGPLHRCIGHCPTFCCSALGPAAFTDAHWCMLGCMKSLLVCIFETNCQVAGSTPCCQLRWRFSCRVARKVIQRSERVLKVPLQKYLTTLILSPITSNSDLHDQCYALVYEVSPRAFATAALIPRPQVWAWARKNRCMHYHVIRQGPSR